MCVGGRRGEGGKEGPIGLKVPIGLKGPNGLKGPIGLKVQLLCNCTSNPIGPSLPPPHTHTQTFMDSLSVVTNPVSL